MSCVGDVEAGRHEVGRQDAAHVAEPDETDAGGHPNSPSAARTSPTGPPHRHPGGRPAVGRDHEQQFVELVVGHARPLPRTGVQAELVHAAERGGHGEHEQAAITRRQRTFPGPRTPGVGGDVVLELPHRRRSDRRPARVDVRVAQDPAAHGPGRVERRLLTSRSVIRGLVRRSRRARSSRSRVR